MAAVEESLARASDLMSKLRAMTEDDVHRAQDGSYVGLIPVAHCELLEFFNRMLDLVDCPEC